ncbi:MAG TPA: DUF6687 family protein [Balneolales bacterium]|nr:DUF6687 family protein [Balneolales bacterium]
MLVDLFFKPFSEAKNKAVMVDGHNIDGLVLSHWKNNRTPPPLKADTSAESVLKLVTSGNADKYIKELNVVTATHFDIDGFVGVAAILNPFFAKKNYDLLKRVAELGDFRKFKTDEMGIQALKICCLINGLEYELYEAPFNEYRQGKRYKSVAKPKFEYFIPKLTDLIYNHENYPAFYEDEYQKVLSDIEYIEKGKVTIEEFPKLDLSIIVSGRPLHYYASFSYAKHDRVISVIEPENYVEFEHKYYTWVDIVSRKTRPRIDLSDIADVLTEKESSQIKWFFTGIEDTAAMLYPSENSNIEKVNLYKSMYRRPRVQSTIPFEQIINLIKNVIREKDSN